MSELLKSLICYIEANKKICDYTSKALTMVKDNWGYEKADIIKYKGYFNQILKLVFQVSWRSDVLSFAIAFEIINIKVVCQLKEYKIGMPCNAI